VSVRGAGARWNPATLARSGSPSRSLHLANVAQYFHNVVNNFGKFWHVFGNIGADICK